jgi:hypothetical protein
VFPCQGIENSEFGHDGVYVGLVFGAMAVVGGGGGELQYGRVRGMGVEGRGDEGGEGKG